MHPGTLHLRPVPLGRGVVEAQHHTRHRGHQRLDEFQQQACGDAFGAASDGGGRGVAPAVLAREPGDADPTTDGSMPTGQDHAQEQDREP